MGWRSGFRRKLFGNLQGYAYIAGMDRGVARNLFWGVQKFLGGINLLNSRSDVICTPESLLGLILGYKYRYTPRLYAPGHGN